MNRCAESMNYRMGDYMTKQRRMILETIRENDAHMSSEEIFYKTKEKLPGIAMATVYNNLKALVQENCIMRIPVPGQPDRYDRNIIRHEHMMCECCGRMIDVQLPDFGQKIRDMVDRPVTGYQLLLYDICDKCASDKSISAGAGSDMDKCEI